MWHSVMGSTLVKSAGSIGSSPIVTIMSKKIIKNVVTCTICQNSADLIEGAYYQCQKNKCHIGDIFVGIFSDLTYPRKSTRELLFIFNKKEENEEILEEK